MSEKRRNYGLSASEKFKGEGSDGNKSVRFTDVEDKGTATGRPPTFRNRKAGDGGGIGRDERDGSARYRQDTCNTDPDAGKRARTRFSF